MDAEAQRIAEMFHTTYERLASNYGYATRTDTRDFDPLSPNGKLMIAVCGEVMDKQAAKLKEENKKFHDALKDISKTNMKLDFNQCQSTIDYSRLIACSMRDKALKALEDS